MKKTTFVCVTVLLLYFVFQISYGVTPSGVIWGPENQGLRMNLRIENADSNQADVYKVVIQLVNVGTTSIELTAQWEEEKDKGDYREYLKKAVVLSSFPEAPPASAQTAGGTERTSPQPTLEIKPSDSVTFEWVTAPRRLKPDGYYNTTPEFSSNGLYSIRAEFLAKSKQGNRILLYSNDCQLAAGGSTAMPKFSVARIIESDPARRKVLLNLGSDQKIEINDRFKCGSFGRWDVLVTEVEDTISTGSVKINYGDASVFPKTGNVATLVPPERQLSDRQTESH
jgi:hypothetical protein